MDSPGQGHRCRPGWMWPDQELDRPVAAGSVPSQSCLFLPDRNQPRPVQPKEETHDHARRRCRCRHRRRHTSRHPHRLRGQLTGRNRVGADHLLHRYRRPRRDRRVRRPAPRSTSVGCGGYRRLRRRPSPHAHRTRRTRRGDRTTPPAEPPRRQVRLGRRHQRCSRRTRSREPRPTPRARRPCSARHTAGPIETAPGEEAQFDFLGRSAHAPSMRRCFLRGFRYCFPA